MLHMERINQMKKFITLLLAVSMVLTLTACGNKVTFEPGNIEGDTYTNTSIGIKATVPEGFVLADDATIEALQAASQNVAENVTTEEKAEAAVAAMSYEMVAMAEDGSSYQIIAEDMTKTTGKVLSASAYVKASAEQVETQYASVGITATSTTDGKVSVAGKDFEVMTVTIEANGITGTQKYYAYKAGNYMFSIIITAMSDDSLATLEQFISSIETAE